MDRSTPIDALRREEMEDPGTRQMVDKIVSEIDDSRMGASALPPGDPRSGGLPGGGEGMYGGMQDDGIAGMQGGGMDYGAPPEYQGMPHEGMYGGGGGMPPPEMYGGGMPPKGMPMPGGMPPGMPPGMQGGMGGGMSDKLLAMAKEPLLVAGLFLVLNNDTVSSLLDRYIPYTDTPFIGLIVKALVAGALYFVLKTFVMNRR